LADKYHHQYISQNFHQKTITKTQAVRFYLTVKNTGSVSWTQDRVHLAAVDTQGREGRIPSLFREDLENHHPSGWVAPNKVKMKEKTVAPGQYAHFEFWMTPGPNHPSMTTKEYFRLEADDITQLEWYGIYWQLTIVDPPPAYSHQYISQNPYPTLRPGQSYQFRLTVKNTGTATWRQGIVNLGTDRPRDRIPGFVREGDGPSGWISPNRIKMQEQTVAPGQYAHFVFWMRVPADKPPGTYREYFRLVADGITWLEDYGIYWDITVE